jgi:hypothetical protein
MRTTVTLDPDVEALIRSAMKERGVSFKEALNSAIRAGAARNRPGKRPFVQKTFALGAEQNFRWDKALAAADALEDEELTRKLSLRK